MSMIHGNDNDRDDDNNNDDDKGDLDLLYDDIPEDMKLPASLEVGNTTSSTSTANHRELYHPSSSTSTIKNSIELVPILQEQIRQLQTENSILKRNIGILYRTAVTELQRKDQQLIELQQQQQHQQPQPSR